MVSHHRILGGSGSPKVAKISFLSRWVALALIKELGKFFFTPYIVIAKDSLTLAVIVLDFKTSDYDAATVALASLKNALPAVPGAQETDFAIYLTELETSAPFCEVRKFDIAFATSKRGAWS